MPQYIYRHPEKEDLYVEVLQKMTEEHCFVDSEGIEWKRVYTLPRISIDSIKIDPYSQKDFVKATNKKGNMGNMLDLSAELSQARAERDGEDPVKKEYFKKYEERNKVKHLRDGKKSVVDNKNFKIDFDKSPGKTVVVEK